MPTMLKRILGVEAAIFLAAAALHSERLSTGYEHPQASVAEMAIGVVLLACVAAIFLFPRRRRAIALGAQTFAILGTLVGLSLIFAGIGPQTTLDLVIHGIMVVTVFFGMLWTSGRITGKGGGSSMTDWERR